MSRGMRLVEFMPRGRLGHLFVVAAVCCRWWSLRGECDVVVERFDDACLIVAATAVRDDLSVRTNLFDSLNTPRLLDKREVRRSSLSSVPATTASHGHGNSGRGSVDPLADTAAMLRQQIQRTREALAVTTSGTRR